MMDKMTHLFTIGFTGSSAEHFFKRLSMAGVRKVIDVRLWPDTQLSGFAKRKDLPYFLKALAGIDYEYRAELAPIEEILKKYKDGQMSWDEYARAYSALLEQRSVAQKINPDEFDGGCFLCAELSSTHCHRRILAEYVQRVWTGHEIRIAHL